MNQSIFKHHGLKLHRSPSKGRHIIANKNIKAGDVIFSEVPLVYATKNDNCCSICFKPPLISCLKCSRRWCCQVCHIKDTIHQSACEIYAKLEQVSRDADCDKVLLELLVNISLLRKSPPQDTTSDAFPVKASISAINHLQSHSKSMNKQWKQSIISALDHLNLSQDLLKDACIINSNSHGFSSGIGIFPFISMINHSCYPNTIFQGSRRSDTDMNILTIRAISDISIGDEITLSYVDIFKPTYDLQHELLETKHFWCRCVRCEMEIDPFSAFTCCKLSSDSCCNSEQVGNDMHHRYISAIQWLDGRIIPFAATQLEKFINHSYGDITPHPLHHLYMQAFIPLINSLRLLGRDRDALKYATEFMNRLHLAVKMKLLPKNWPDVVDYIYWYAELQMEYGRKIQSEELICSARMNMREYEKRAMICYGGGGGGVVVSSVSQVATSVSEMVLEVPKKE